MSRNVYKGHIDKAKGARIEGGRQGWVGHGAWWGENGDNYTWTAIKKIKLKKSDPPLSRKNRIPPRVSNTIRQCPPGCRGHFYLMILSSLSFFFHSQILIFRAACLFHCETLKQKNHSRRCSTGNYQTFPIHISHLLTLSQSSHSQRFCTHCAWHFQTLSPPSTKPRIYLSQLPKNDHLCRGFQASCAMSRLHLCLKLRQRSGL